MKWDAKVKSCPLPVLTEAPEVKSKALEAHYLPPTCPLKGGPRPTGPNNLCATCKVRSHILKGGTREGKIISN